MERLLELYALAYDPRYPVVCYDKRPCFLIGDRLEPLALQSGQLRKEPYAYEKRGSAALLAAIEPLPGGGWLKFSSVAPSGSTPCFVKP